jgi:hypothetical protein
MSDSVAIGRLAVRWAVPAESGPDTGGGGAVRREALVAALLDGPLEDALSDVGTAPGEEVCVRVVAVPEVCLGFSLPDAALVQAWSRAIGSAVAQALRDGGSTQGVVRYRSRSHAAVDLAVGCLTGEMGRVWAWRQLGLWPDGLGDGGPGSGGGGLPSGVAGHVARTLEERPGLVVPVLVRLAETGRLESAVAAFGAAGLRTLAAAAWRSAGGGGLPVPAAVFGRPRPPAAARGGHTGLPPQGQPAAALVAGSRLAASLAAGPRFAPDMYGTWAALVVLESEPASVGTGTAGASLVAAVAFALGPDNPHWPGPGRRSAVAPTAAEAAVVPTAAEAGGPGEDSVPPAAAAGTEADAGQGVRTAWAGLLFCLHVVGELDVPGRMAATDGGQSGGLRAALYALGCEIAALATTPEPPETGDAALMAFCGLAAGGGQGAPEASEGLRSAVRFEARRVAAELSRRVAPDDADAAAVLARVCRRRARIVCDPGWTDVVLDLDAVDTDVRRAGLDLDPGYLPWLGCVVRFRYA